MKINFRYFLYTNQVKEAVDEAILEPKIKAAILVQTFARKSMKKGGGKKGRPSAPGTPPHVQKGHLRASVEWAMTEDGKVIVGPTVPYGALHEFGGILKAQGKLFKYPERAYMRPALLHTMVKFPALFKDLKLDKTQVGKYLNTKNGKRNG